MATVVNRQAMSDADLIAASRLGDTDAFAELYRRHEPAARGAARALCRNRSDADDLVSEAFISVLRVLQNGNGPDVAFRPYLLVAVRNRFYDRTRKRTEESYDEPTQEFDLPLLDTRAGTEDKMLAATAFASLPERWQLVLWHSEIEGRSPAEISPLIGLAPNAVAALAYRAREGLRQAYLQAHLLTPHESGCRDCAANLGAYVRDGLSIRDRKAVDQHLAGCESCRLLLAELSDTNEMLRAGLLPAILGVSTATYLSRAGKGALAWFARLSRLQQAGAASTAAAAAVVAGVLSAAVIAPTPSRPSVAAAPETTRASTTSVVESAVEAPVTSATGTTVVVTTVPPLSSVDPPAATTTRVPLGPISRVPVHTVPLTPATTVPGSATSTTVATTVPPPTTTVPAVVAQITLSSVQIGVALLGGQVRVGLTISASVLPTLPGTRAFSNLVVSVGLPAGVSVAAADNPGWSCTAAGTCTVSSLTTGSASSSVLTLAIAADVTAPIAFAPAVTSPAGSVVESQPLTITPASVPGLQLQEFARGSVTAIGNSATCVVVLCASLPTSADLSITGTVTKALLVWSGVSTSGSRDQVKLTLPNSDVLDVSADQIVGSYSSDFVNAYAAYADVTSLVSEGGTYSVSGLRTGLIGYGGWSLLVATHDDSQPLRSLMITAPIAYVSGSSSFSLTPGGSVVPTADVHLIVSAFEGTALAGDLITFNGIDLSDPFKGVLDVGVDLVDITAADVGAGTGTLDISSTNDAVMVAAIGLAVDLS